MDGWMRDFYVTLAWARPNRQAGTKGNEGMALVARVKLPTLTRQYRGLRLGAHGGYLLSYGPRLSMK